MVGRVLRDPQQFNFLWVDNFPLFEVDEDGGGTLLSSHHCFTAPKPGDEAHLATDPLKVRRTVGPADMPVSFGAAPLPAARARLSTHALII